MRSDVEVPRTDRTGAPEAAAYLGVVQRTVYRMIDEGQLPQQVGRVIRLRWDDIEAFNESCRLQSGDLYHL